MKGTTILFQKHFIKQTADNLADVNSIFHYHLKCSLMVSPRYFKIGPVTCDLSRRRKYILKLKFKSG